MSRQFNMCFAKIELQNMFDKHTYQLLCFKQFVMFFRSCLCSKDLQLLVHKATRLPKALYQAWQQGLQRTLSVDMPRQRSDFELLNQKTFNTCSTSFVYDTLYIYISKICSDSMYSNHFSYRSVPLK